MATEKLEKLPERGRAGVREPFAHDLYISLLVAFLKHRPKIQKRGTHGGAA